MEPVSGRLDVMLHHLLKCTHISAAVKEDARHHLTERKEGRELREAQKVLGGSDSRKRRRTISSFGVRTRATEPSRTYLTIEQRQHRQS